MREKTNYGKRQPQNRRMSCQTSRQSVLGKQTADEVKDTRDEADRVIYVTMRNNKRNQPLSANFVRTSMHQKQTKQCPAYGRQCRKCGQLKHFQSKCKQHKYVKQLQAAVCDREYSVGTLWDIDAVH